MTPPYPSEITAFEPPLPLGISNDLPWGGGGGYGYFLEPHILVCSTFFPFCISSHSQVQPCHHHFLEVKSSCIHHFHTSNIAWPSTLNCSKLPSPPQVCISPPLSDFSLLYIFTFLHFFTSPSST